MEKKDKRFTIIVLVLIIGCFLYLGLKITYTSYESNIDVNTDNTLAGISIKINGVDVTSSNNGVLDNRIILDNITWVSTHTRDEKISPGSSGTINLEIDPTHTDVAVLYEFQFIDKRIDDDKLLTFGTISSNDSTITRTARDTYTGVITVAELNQNKKVHIDADFFFDYLNDIEGITEDTQLFDDLFEIHFHAVQYRGETIQPYVEE